MAFFFLFFIYGIRCYLLIASLGRHGTSLFSKIEFHGSKKKPHLTRNNNEINHIGFDLVVVIKIQAETVAEHFR